MKSKSLLFTYILLAVAFLEGLVVVYDLLRPAQKIELATAELDVPERVVIIPPMLFERNSAATAAQELDELITQYMQQSALLKQVVNEATENTAINNEKKVLEEETSAKNELPEGKKIAIVIDDLGVSPQNTKDILSLEKTITASFLPYAPANKEQVTQAKKAGFEVMLHVPMMPHHRVALAPVTLAPEMDKETIQKHLREFMAYYDGTGMRAINNHMGSEFMENSEGLGYVMEVLKEKGWFFLDSKTTGKSAAKNVAAQYNVPYIARDVFLDNENNYDYIMGQLHETEKIANKYGYAVAIGHPHPQTYKALHDWMKDIEDRGFILVHLSDLLNSINLQK